MSQTSVASAHAQATLRNTTLASAYRRNLRSLTSLSFLISYRVSTRLREAHKSATGLARASLQGKAVVAFNFIEETLCEPTHFREKFDASMLLGVLEASSS